MTDVSFRDPRTLKPNPFNPNHVGPENMVKLVKSISDLGFVTAVVVRELPSGELQILGGQHRVEAAMELGLKEVPVVNVGRIADAHAKKIGLVDNSRYGTDDTIGLAQLYEELGLSSEELASFMPFTEVDFDTISKSVDIDLDELDMMLGDDDPPPSDDRPSKPSKTHDVLKFRMSLGDAERVRKLIEKTMKREGLSDDDELTAAGSALAILLFKTEEA